MAVILPEPPPRSDRPDTPEPAPPAEPAPPGWENILGRGEQILWQGKPDAGVVWSDLVQVQTLFGVFFTGFALFWMSAAAGMTHRIGSPGGMERLFPLFGLIFVGIGLYMVIGRLFWDALQRRGTHYTLTNRTAFIASAGLGARRLDRYPLGPRMPLTLEDNSPGTVWFAQKVTHNPGGWRGTGADRRYEGPSTRVTRIGFRRIAEARRVYRLILDAVEAQRAASPPER